MSFRKALEAQLSDRAIESLQSIARSRGCSLEEAARIAVMAEMERVGKTDPALAERMRKAMEDGREDVASTMGEQIEAITELAAMNESLEAAAAKADMLRADLQKGLRQIFDDAFKDEEVKPDEDTLQSYVDVLSQDDGKAFTNLIQAGYATTRVARALSYYSAVKGREMDEHFRRSGKLEDPDPLVMQEVRRIADEAKGAKNLERLLMRLYRLTWLLASKHTPDDEVVEGVLIGFALCWGTTSSPMTPFELPLVARGVMDELQRTIGFLKVLVEGGRWTASGMPIVRIDPKLAAALVFTDLPPDFVDSSIRLPWPAFRIRVPEAVLLDSQGRPIEEVLVFAHRTEESEGEEAKVLFRMTAIVDAGGEAPVRLARTVTSLSALARSAEREEGEWDNGPDVTRADARVMSLCGRLVVGACLRMSDPDAVRKRSNKAVRGTTGNVRKFGVPQTSEFILGGEVKVDLRQELRDVSAGRKGARFHKVQWLVRGHWRNQPYGEGRSQRRMKWIEPHFKGPERAPLLAKDYSIGEGSK